MSEAQTSKTWHELRHPATGTLVAKYCPQTHEIESVDRGKRAVIKLPAVVRPAGDRRDVTERPKVDTA